MLYSPADWANKRKEGIGRFLAIDGVLKLGAPFAFVMKAIGMLVFRAEGETLGQYISSSRTWTAFFLNATAFGLAMGFINWRRNEANYFSAKNAGEIEHK
jgi:uncharacterized membrane protein